MLKKVTFFFHVSENYKNQQITGLHKELFHAIDKKYIRFFVSKSDTDYTYGFGTKQSNFNELDYKKWKDIYNQILDIVNKFNLTLDKKYKILVLNHLIHE